MEDGSVWLFLGLLVSEKGKDWLRRGCLCAVQYCILAPTLDGE